MKKKVVGLMVSVLTMGALSLTALAVPNYNCFTSITNARHTAMGVTECSTATSCGVTVTGHYNGGSKNATSWGVVATSAGVHVDSPYVFTSADSNHTIYYYSNGVSNVHRDVSGTY